MSPQQAHVAQATDVDQLAINTIRTLVIDAIQKANSGHPGTPMGAAPTAYTLWQQFLRYDPEQPMWPNRDRFVLSSGHASMLLYALIHLAGVKAANPSYEKVGSEAVTLDDIKTFRQEGSRCPGHPEYGWTSGVESTTGPLGQGVSTSVGMAIAGCWLAGTYNRPGFELFDFNVYALCGDGDMMEGISSEAAYITIRAGSGCNVPRMWETRSEQTLLDTPRRYLCDTHDQRERDCCVVCGFIDEVSSAAANRPRGSKIGAAAQLKLEWRVRKCSPRNTVVARWSVM